MSDTNFSDMEVVEQVRLVVSTVMVAKESGMRAEVVAGTLKGKPGILIWIPGYDFDPDKNTVVEAKAEETPPTKAAD